MLFTRRRVAAAALLLCAATAAGCSDLDEPGQSLNRNDLVADLAAQMAGAADLTYEASYQLAGGGKATVAQTQKPTRTAYVYPGGKITVTKEATTRCRDGKPATCTMTAPATAASPPPATLFAGADDTGLVTPAAVLTLLNAAVLDNDVEVQQHDTTIAGRHATCVQLNGVDDAAARDFTTCITNEGVLGSFNGILNQTRTEVAMTHYSDEVDDALFELPAAAKLVDNRKD